MKKQRVLDIYLRLLLGKEIKTNNLINEYKVSKRTIYRDISDLKNFLISANSNVEIIYNEENGSYTLDNKDIKYLSKYEIWVICKILLNSEVLKREEMFELVEKLLSQYSNDEDFKYILRTIENDKFHYEESSSSGECLEKIYDFSEAIQSQYKIIIEEETEEKIIKPIGISLFEKSFYLLAYDDEVDVEQERAKLPNKYKIENIKNYEVLKNRKFAISYQNKFREGDLRKTLFQSKEK